MPDMYPEDYNALPVPCSCKTNYNLKLKISNKFPSARLMGSITDYSTLCLPAIRILKHNIKVKKEYIKYHNNNQQGTATLRVH